MAIGLILHPIRGTIQPTDIARITRRVRHAKRTRVRLVGFAGDRKYLLTRFPDWFYSVFFAIGEKANSCLTDMRSVCIYRS